MKIFQETITLVSKQRGFHLVTEEIISKSLHLSKINVGLAHLFLMHTSAALTINENADPSVRSDFETFSNHLIPESFSYFEHTLEGSDDMPAHLKSSLYGNTLSIPVKSGNFILGTWQGIYLCEHRDHGGARRLTLTLTGEENE